MKLHSISPDHAIELAAKGARLVDVREPDEYAREHINGSQHVPLSGIDSLKLEAGAPIIFLCQSGMRTQANVEKLALTVDEEAYLIEGGLNAWKKAGGSVEVDQSQPMPIMRQVQIAAGSLVLIGVLLGWLVSPGFYGLAAFVGAGLVFAGVSGTCAMANILMLMPWNRRAVGGKAVTA